MRVKNLLMATDFSESAATAESAAIDLAERFAAQLHWLHVIEVPYPIFEPYGVPVPIASIEGFRDVAQQKIAERAARCEERGVHCSVHVAEGRAVLDIGEHAKEIEADWIVIGTHGYRGIQRWLLGSVAERTAREAPCSVLAVKSALGVPRCIVVGVDFSQASGEAVEAAAQLAQRSSASLHLVHALDLGLPIVTPYEVSVPSDLVEAAHRAAADKLATLAAELGKSVSVDTHLMSEPAADALSGVATSVGADLVVTGSRGLGGLSRVLLGSVAERTLRISPCSVLVYRTAS